jgi:glycosyltransferase involved in cell wall biosynthesis
VARKTISVALATYNGSRYLQDQLRDLASQSLLPDEVVISDDASSDETVSIARHFARSAPFPVHVHRNATRLGFRANFMQCAGRCGSDLIAFCDQDDRWSAEKLRTVANHFDDPDVLLVHHNARVFGENGEPSVSLYPTSRKQGPSRALERGPWDFAPGFTQLFSRHLLQFDDLWPMSQDENADGERIPHDRWYYFLASALGTTVYVAECLADYRQHGDNAYGWRGFAPSFAARTRDRVRHAGHVIARRGRAAESRANILDKVAPRLGGPDKSRARSRAKAYRTLAERCALRSAIYQCGSLSKRISAFSKLMQARSYGPDPWQIGPLGFMMDTTMGVPGLGSGSVSRVTGAYPNG